VKAGAPALEDDGRRLCEPPAQHGRPDTRRQPPVPEHPSASKAAHARQPVQLSC